MRRVVVVLTICALAAPVAASQGASGPTALELSVAVEREPVQSGHPYLAKIVPSWNVSDADFDQYLCYALHTTYGKLRPRTAPDTRKSFRPVRPPIADAPIGGTWMTSCYVVWDVFRKNSPLGYVYQLDIVDWKDAGPAVVRAYLYGLDDHRVRASAEQFVRLPAQPTAARKPAKPPAGKPAKKPTGKPVTKPTGKSGKRLSFTVRLSGKPVVGAERLFASYQGSQAHAQGSLRSAAPVGEADLLDAMGSVSLVHAYSAFPDERYSLELAATNNSFTKTFSNGRAARIGVKVTASSFSGCPAGRTGVVVVSDLTNGDGFEVNLCGIRLVWVDGKGASVAVVIRAA